MTNQQLIELIEKLGLRIFIGEVLQELERAEALHPEWPKDMVHAAAIVAEESGELIRAALQNSDDAMTEAIQTTAMGFRFLKNFYQYPTCTI